MIAIKTVIICMCVMVMVDLLQNNEWHSIVPLHSTRADVERLLGPPDKSGAFYNEYNLKNEKVFIQYSDGTCEGAPSEWRWNVSRNTVIYISVYPKTKPKLADLKLDEIKYRKERDHHEQIVYYHNDEEGISIEVNMDAGVANAFRYTPAAKDDHLRCPTTAENLDDAGDYCSRKFDWYSDIPLNKEKERLDEFAAQLQHERNAKGYICAYDGRHARVGEARAKADRAKSYLIKEHGMEAGRVVVIDTGYREELTIELWIKPNGCRVPAASPTDGPREVQIIKKGSARNTRWSPRPRCKPGSH